MKRIVEGETVAAWAAARLGCRFSPPFVAIGLAIDEAIVGGLIFNGFTGPDIEMTVAGSPHAWTPAFVRRAARYVWDELGCLRVSITTEQPSVAAMARRLGAETEGVKRDAFGPGRDAILLGIRRQNWRLTR